MAIIRFGNTWWGNRFLHALNDIDFSNRLPRGQRYARNGSVRSIDINENHINARVQGRRPRPYKISINLSPFSPKEREKIENLIKENHYYISQFEIQVLPSELYEELLQIGINIFPSTWKDMNMYCSCPDMAVPCKHLAAVIYIIANEIDKNPFIIFNLHKYDILGTFKQAGKTEEDIVSMDSLLEEKPDKYSYFQEKLEHLDFSIIPDMLESQARLLTPKPLFYLKNDFKEILHKMYHVMRKKIRQYIQEVDIFESTPDIQYTSLDIKIYKTAFDFTGVLKKNDQVLSFNFSHFHPLIDYIQVLTLGDLNMYPPVISFIIMVHSYTLMLIQKSAFIPDIISLGNDKYIIRWIPSLFNNEVKTIFFDLVEAIPSNMVKYGTTALSKKDQVLFLISFFIYYYIKMFSPVQAAAADPVLSLFFMGTEFAAAGFENREIAKTINLWLNRFFVHPKNCFPVIKIDEGKTEDEFLFDVLIKDRREILEKPKGIAEFIDSDNDEKFPMLKDLSLLSTYLPSVSMVLKSKTPVSVSPDSFVQIWFDALPVLKILNIETLLPQALKDVMVPAMTLSFSKKMKQDSNIVTYLSIERLMDFNWTIALGDRFIDVNEFRNLCDRYSGIVKYKNQYIYLDPKEVEKIKKQMSKEPRFSPLDILKIQLEDRYKDTPVQTEAELKALFKKLFEPEQIPVPGNLAARLRPYQETGFKWLYHNSKIGFGSLIADDMGLGKTIQIITLILEFKNRGYLQTKKALIVVPASLVTNWCKELSKFAPDLSVAVYHGTEREIKEETDVVITTYGLLRSDTDHFQSMKWLCIIIDEAQNIKNPSTNQTQAVKSIHADIRIAMTGTPVENRLMDYWSILDFLMKNLLGSKLAFKKNFAVPIEKFKNGKKITSFKSLTAPFILRRVKTDKSIISDLPDKLTSDQYTSLTKEQAVLYEDFISNIDDIISGKEDFERAGIIFRLILGLKQICNHPALFLKEKKGKTLQSGKTLLLIDLLEKIMDAHEKVLIFTQFTEMGYLLEYMIEDTFNSTPLFFHGGLTRKNRDAVIDRFQNEKEARILILSLKAGGTGLNLIQANNVIHYDLWWNPAVESQATDRVYRIGQQKNVNVYRFITKGTFEEKINDMIEHKKELADLTISTGEKWITELSNRELKELLKLER
ncbi:MAG: DEAD/DEAH box helicase [Spirochaetales bacterium]|nr:DEAD/DEAH box helicase [Spirochaetales bacterium]